jgi:hypothetical protein
MNKRQRRGHKKPRRQLSAPSVPSPMPIIGQNSDGNTMTTNQDQNHGDKPKDNPTDQAKEIKSTRHIVIATWIIAVTGIVLGWIQTCSNRGAVQADLRAYVQVVNPRLDRPTTEPIMWISVVNFGKTPANNVSPGPIFSLWKRDSLPIDPGKIKRDSLLGEFMIAPSETLYVPLRPNLGFWKRDSMSATQVFGVVYYTDHRGEPHRTVFAYQWENISRSYRKMARFNYGD